MNNTIKVMLTGSVILIAVGVAGFKYWDYLHNPWTRDGQVHAQVIQITPRVSAPIIDLPIRDNQFVAQGDLLFALDPRTFTAALAEAEANLDKTRDDLIALSKEVDAAVASVEQYDAQIEAAVATLTETRAELERTKVDVDRAAELLKTGNVSKRRYDQAVADYEAAVGSQNNAVAIVTQARASKLGAVAALAKARANLGAPGLRNARIRAASAAVQTAKLNLEFTEVRAPVDGYVTNLNLRLGSQGIANQPALALVDTGSFWINGFFRETFVGDMSAGDQAVVTLMSYPDKALTGTVDSIGWGIAQDDGSTGYNLLPQINPTFDWIRLAQRVPVRIHLDTLPDGVELRVGTTASVLVRTGTAGTNKTQRPETPAPAALQ